MNQRRILKTPFLFALALSSGDGGPLSQGTPMKDIFDIKPMISLTQPGIPLWIWAVVGLGLLGLVIVVTYFALGRTKVAASPQSHLQKAESLRERLRHPQEISMKKRYHYLGMMLRSILANAFMPQAPTLTLEEIHRQIMTSPRDFAFKKDVEAFIRELGEIEYGGSGMVPEEKDFFRNMSMMDRLLDRELAENSSGTKEGI